MSGQDDGASLAEHSARGIGRNLHGQVWSRDLLPHTKGRGQPAYFADVKGRLTRDEAERVLDLLHRGIDRA